MDKRTYTILGGSTSVIALVIDQVLWLVTNLRFGPGILIGVFVPLFIGGVGVSAGVRAMTRYGPRFGVTDGVRGLALLAVVAFLGILAWYLGQPGYTHVRFGFFTVLGALALVGALGVVRHSPRLVAVSAGGLFLLGFWQAVLWMYVYPVIGLLVVAALLDHDGTTPDPTPP